MKPNGRPHTYCPTVASQICRRIADGEPLRTICGPGRARGIPQRVTVYNWLHRYPAFMKAYLLARRAQAELYLDDVVEIADGQGGEVARDRLRVDARLKMAALMAPRITSGLEEVAAKEPPSRTPFERATRIAAILTAARRRLEAQGEVFEDED